VHLCGSFTRWVETVPMTPVEGQPGAFSVIVQLPAGYHQYKFIVDGEWRHDETQPFMPDPLGNVNNWLFVRRPDTAPSIPPAAPRVAAGSPVHLAPPSPSASASPHPLARPAHPSPAYQAPSSPTPLQQQQQQQRVFEAPAVASPPSRHGSGVVDPGDVLAARRAATADGDGNAYSRLQQEDVTVGQALTLASAPTAPTQVSAWSQQSQHLGPKQRVWICTADDSLRTVVERLAVPGVRRLVVVDGATHRVEGIVSLSDVATFLMDSLRSHLRSLGTVLGQATKTATNAAMEVSRAVATEVGGARCLQDYALQAQVATGGPQGLWRIYSAQAKKSVLTAAPVWDVHLCAPASRSAQHLARLKHPLVLRLLSPLEETRTQMVFVTEAVVTSLADYLAACEGPPPPLSVSHPGNQSSPSAVRMSELELKHGVLQMADAIHFLHSGASMAHRGICPHAVFIARAGGWKLACFAFATPLDFRDGEASGGFDFSDRHPSMLAAALKPSLAYCAPELVASGAASAGGMLSACDAFSMAALTYELFAHRQLLPVGSDLITYESYIRSLTQRDLDGVPMELWGPLRGMLAPIPSARTPVEAFTASAYFQGDTRLRALRFLGTLMQREPAQKAAFFKDLETMLGSLDGRVLRTLVLPPVLGELHNAALAPTLVPLVMRL
ncbi:hypothetical protein APUTEX25_001549, partial [Auxenochlorella protothecoides]